MLDKNLIFQEKFQRKRERAERIRMTSFGEEKNQKWVKWLVGLVLEDERGTSTSWKESLVCNGGKHAEEEREEIEKQ